MKLADHKICFKCGRDLPIDSYYRHPKMGDGHLNKCKECAKNDVHSNYSVKKLSNEFMSKQRKRGRDKYHRLYSQYNNELFTQYKSQDWSSYGKHASSSDYKYIKTILADCDVFYDESDKDIQWRTEIHHWSYEHDDILFVLPHWAHVQVHHLLRFDKSNKCFINCFTGDKITTYEDMEAIIRKYCILYAICDVKNKVALHTP